MKKIFLILSIFCISTSLFALSDRYEKIMKAARSAEERKNYVYALNYYYEAMEEEPFLGVEAFTNFKSLSDKVRSGNPSGEDLDPFDMNDLWCEIINSYNQYYSKNNPYMYVFDELLCSSLDYIKKTSNWTISYKVMYLPKYEIIYDCLTEGFNNTNFKEWNNVDPKWLDSVDVIKELNFEIDIIGSKDGKIIGSAATENKTAYFDDVNRGNTKILNSKKIKLNVKSPEGTNAVIQTPYKKNKIRTDIIKFYESLKTELMDSDRLPTPESFPFFYINDYISEDIYDYIMEDYYNWQEKNVKEENRTNINDIYVFCNLLSQKFNLKSCYSVNGSTNVKNWGLNGNNTVECNYDAAGFRLPTEEEIKVHPKIRSAKISDKKFAVVRSDVVKRRAIIAEKNAKDEENLRLQKERELEEQRLAAEEERRIEEMNRIAAEQENLEAEQARLDAEAEAKEAALALKKQKRQLAIRKIKRVADKSIRNTVTVKGSADNFSSDVNVNLDLNASFGYHFLFAFSEVEYKQFYKFIKEGFDFSNFNTENIGVLFGAGISYPLGNVGKVYGTVGFAPFEKSVNQFTRYGVGFDYTPFGRGFTLNIEGAADYNKELDNTKYRVSAGLGVSF